MLNLDVRTGDALGFIDRLSKQAPFAVAIGINRTTELAMVAAGKGIQSRMTIRVPRFILPPIVLPNKWRARPDKLFAVADIAYDDGPDSIGHRRRVILAKFEDGGTRRAVDPNVPIALPTRAVRPSDADLIARKMYPRYLVGRFEKAETGRGHLGQFIALARTANKKGKRQKQVGRYFVLGQPGDRGYGVFERLSPGRIRMLWAFRTQVPVHPLLHYQEDISNAVNANFEKEVRSAMDFAIALEASR